MPDPTNEELEKACSRLLAWGDVIHGLSERGILDGMIARALPAKLDRIAELGKIIDLWAVSLSIACEDRDKLKHANRDLETQLRVAREQTVPLREAAVLIEQVSFSAAISVKDSDRFEIVGKKLRAASAALSVLSPQKETTTAEERK